MHIFMLAGLGDLLSQFANWLKSVLLYIPKYLWAKVLDALASLIEAIPVPDAFAQFANNISGIGGGVSWFLDLMQFKFGVAIILAAYLGRFLIRRLPFVG